jgi:predicted metal-dependent phosphoesterase TrpH
MAQDKEITAIALTDHDSIEGLAEAEIEAKKCNMNFLKGIEISVSYGQQRLLHILGLGINPENEYFIKVYNRLRTVREEGLERVLWILNKQGISIKMQQLNQYATGKYLDRHTLTKYFVDKKICRNVPEVWHNYLDPIAYGQGELLEADEAIDIIKKSGGLSFLAHFHKKIGLDGYTNAEVEQHIKYLVSLGLDGIEQYYPSYSKENKEYAQYLINTYKLIASGGTDFHGSNRPEIALGIGEKDFNVPDSVYNDIRLRVQN